MTEEYEPTGEITLARRGLAALELLNSLPDGTTGQHLTEDQRTTLAGWGGWGPLAKALGYEEPHRPIGQRLSEIMGWQAMREARNACDTAFYTPATVRRAMWDLVAALGFTGGRVLEPGCGSGRFITSAPPGLTGMEWTGVEADKASAEIATLLHPQARVVHGRLEKTSLRQNGFDLAVGNVPFSSQGVYDPNCLKDISSLHGYFLWRALNAVRPGGLAVFVTSRWTLDSEGTAERYELARLGVFLGALRLPGSALAPGGTRAVTDIIVWRRRYSASERHLDDRWLPPASKPDGLDTTVSGYFQANPERVLGTMANRGGKQYGMTLDVTLAGGEDLAVRLDDAVQALAGQIAAAGLGWQPPSSAPGAAGGPGDDPDMDPAADGAYTLHGDGSITQQRDARHVTVPADPELTCLIRLKVASLALFAAEADEAMGNNERERIRQAALRAYQEYTAWYGYLGQSELTTRPDPDDPDAVIIVRSRPSRARRSFGQDPDWPTVLAVEEWNDDTQAGKPAAVLTRHVGARPKRKEHTDDPGEALGLCLDECAQVDVEVLARILQVPEADVPGLLGDAIWQDPSDPDVWVTADEFLSGNVRVKLTAAKNAAETDEKWAGHVAALEAVQPEDLGPEQISVQLGAPWLPPETVQQFVCDLLRVQDWNADQVTVRYEKYTSTWEVRASTEVRKLPAANLTWGTARVNAVNLIQDACNNQTPTVYDKLAGPPETTVKNHTETALAADKIRDLNERFAEWWCEDPKRSDRLCRVYNDRFNATRVRTFDGSLLTFPGLAGWFKPYPSQRDMIWRNVCTGTTLCGHVVGAGKTAIAVCTALTLRRLGLARKPCMVVPNHLLEQTCAEARRYYPGAKILMVTKEDLNPARHFAARCAARDWDLVVMTIQQFGSLPVHPAVQEEYYGALLDELDEAMNDPAAEESRATAKMLARKRRKLIARLDALGDWAKDTGLTFGETGIDYLVLDEAHWAKNLSFVARAEGFNTDGSKRADDLLMKLTWLRKQSPDGHAAMLMTGTPVSNSLAELHTLFRYCAPHLLAEQDLISFDSFAAQYIRYATSTEVAPDGGGFRSYRRPRSFVNLPELRVMLWQFADIRTRDDLTLNGPAVTVDHVVVEGPPELAPFTQDLVARADAIRNGKVKPHEDNMLMVCGAGRAAALWMPLVGITPTGPGKIERCAAQVAAIYQQAKEELYPDPTGEELFDTKPGAMQVVFCDMGTPGAHDGGVYDYLRELLVHAGVPRARIVFIHDAKTHQARAALFSRCRAGDVSVIIGSTEKMGTGVNIQRRMAAIHHLDAPWRPADVEQRDGRGDRPGNDHGTLRVFRYATKGSFDAYMWQALERKKRFIDQILCGDPHVREVEAVDNPQVLSYGQLKALATGQPLLMMLSEVQAEIARLRNSSAGHKRAQARMAFDQRAEQENAARWGKYADLLKGTARKAADAGDGDPVAVFTGDHARTTGGEAIAGRLGDALASARRNRTLSMWFEYRGNAITIELGYRKTGPPVLTGIVTPHHWDRDKGWTFSLSRGWKQATLDGDSGPGHLLTQIDEVIDGAEDQAAELTERKTACLARAQEMAPYLDTEWDGKAQLAEALKRRAGIEKDIDAQVKDSRQPQPQPA